MPPARLATYDSTDSSAWRDRLSLPAVAPPRELPDAAMPLELAVRVEQFLKKHSRSKMVAHGHGSVGNDEFDFLLSVEGKVGGQQSREQSTTNAAVNKTNDAVVVLPTLGFAVTKETERSVEGLRFKLSQIKSGIAEAKAEQEALMRELDDARPREWKQRLNDTDSATRKQSEEEHTMFDKEHRRWSGGNTPQVAQRKEGRKFNSFSARSRARSTVRGKEAEGQQRPRRSKSFSAGDRVKLHEEPVPPSKNNSARTNSTRSVSFSLYQLLKGVNRPAAPFVSTANLFSRSRVGSSYKAKSHSAKPQEEA